MPLSREANRLRMRRVRAAQKATKLAQNTLISQNCANLPIAPILPKKPFLREIAEIVDSATTKLDRPILAKRAKFTRHDPSPAFVAPSRRDSPPLRVFQPPPVAPSQIPAVIEPPLQSSGMDKPALRKSPKTTPSDVLELLKFANQLANLLPLEPREIDEALGPGPDFYLDRVTVTRNRTTRIYRPRRLLENL